MEQMTLFQESQVLHGINDITLGVISVHGTNDITLGVTGLHGTNDIILGVTSFTWNK